MLSANDSNSFVHALLNTFPLEELRDLLRFRLDINLDRVVNTSQASEQIFSDLVQVAEGADWARDLLEAAYKARPDVKTLASLYEKIGLAPKISVQRLGVEGDFAMQAGPAEGFEQVIARRTFLPDISQWREGLAKVEGKVCRIEIDGRPSGTGFLVGPDVVLTCYHVLEPMIQGAKEGSMPTVRCRFDFKVLADGTSLQGLVVGLAPQWLIDFSPYAPGEGKASAATRLPTPDELDYALIRLARPVGMEPADGADWSGMSRGWISISDTRPLAEPGTPLMIVHYPDSQSLKLTIANEGLIGTNENGTRLRYSLDVDTGSSGAPCFNWNWELVAVHHFQDPRSVPPYQQGIPITAIRDRLERVGKAGILGGAPPSNAKPPQPGPVLDPDDPQRNRWGGKSERNGRKVTAELVSVHDELFVFNVSVHSTDGSHLQCPVLFHLHYSYPKSVIWIRKIRGHQQAVLEKVTSYGVYTVGVQVKDAQGNWIGLELPLTKLEGLPKRFLDL